MLKTQIKERLILLATGCERALALIPEKDLDFRLVSSHQFQFFIFLT